MHKNSFKFCFGAMGCGKTNELIGDYYKKTTIEKEVIVIKPKTDKKGDNCIVARNGIKVETTFVVDTTENIYDLITKYLYENQLDYILVDEIQFFGEEHIKQLSKIVTQLGISIIGYGIITDFQGKMFPGAIHVMEYADNFKYLPSELPLIFSRNCSLRSARIFFTSIINFILQINICDKINEFNYFSFWNISKFYLVLIMSVFK